MGLVHPERLRCKWEASTGQPGRERDLNIVLFCSSALTADYGVPLDFW